MIQDQQLQSMNQCSYQDSVQSAADLHQAPLGSQKHISTTAPRPPQPITLNKPTSHKFNPSSSNADESLQYHSSKSIVDPSGGSLRYSQRQHKTNLPDRPQDFGEHKFLHSFNAHPHAPAQGSAHLRQHQMRGKETVPRASPVGAQPHHGVSLADPSFHHQENYFGGGKQTLADHFQDKFSVNPSKTLQLDSRSRSHENTQSAKGRSQKQPLGRIDHNQQ